MWSVGCIFAEMLGRKPAFPGKDYIHQLKLILEVLGTQDEASLHFISSPKARAWIQSLPPAPPASLATLFPAASPEALQLLAAMLVFDPRRRISVEAALAHPYLASLHDPTLEPGAPAPFAADGEEADLKEEQLRRKVFDEVMSYAPPPAPAAPPPS
jgi:mitogen-activated protein kinase 1/3